MSSVKPLLERLKAQLAWNFAQLGRERRFGFFKAAQFDQQAHIVKTGVVVAGVHRQRIGQLFQGRLLVAAGQQRLRLVGFLLGNQFAFAGQVFIQERFDLAGSLRAHEAVDRLAAHHQDAGGDAANAKGLRQLLLVVRVDFDQGKAAAVVGFQLLQNRPKRLARAAPRGPEVDEDRLSHRRGNHVGFKILQGHFNHDGLGFLRAIVRQGAQRGSNVKFWT